MSNPDSRFFLVRNEVEHEFNTFHKEDKSFEAINENINCFNLFHALNSEKTKMYDKVKVKTSDEFETLVNNALQYFQNEGFDIEPPKIPTNPNISTSSTPEKGNSEVCCCVGCLITGAVAGFLVGQIGGLIAGAIIGALIGFFISSKLGSW